MINLYTLAQILVPPFLKIAFNIHYEGSERFTDYKTGCIVCANHRSNFDPMIVGAALRGRQMRFMAKEELFKGKIAKAFMNGIGAFPIRRGKGDTEAIEKTIEIINSGQVLAIFPEGTRSKTGKPQRAKSGVALFAAKCGVPVYPIGISYKGKIRFRTRVTVRVGEPIIPEELAMEEITPDKLRSNAAFIMGKIVELIDTYDEAENGEMPE